MRRRGCGTRSDRWCQNNDRVLSPDLADRDFTARRVQGDAKAGLRISETWSRLVVRPSRDAKGISSGEHLMTSIGSLAVALTIHNLRIQLEKILDPKHP